MPGKDFREALNQRYTQAQRDGKTSPTRQQFRDRKQAIRQQVNPSPRPMPMPYETPGKPGIGGPGPMPMPYETPPSTGGLDPSPYTSQAAALSPYPEFSQSMSAGIAPPSFTGGPVAGPNGPGFTPGPTIAPQHIPGPTMQPFTLSPTQPSAVSMQAQPQPKPGDQSFGPVTTGTGAW